MEIQTALSRASSFSELLQIAENSDSHLSFFGSKYISVSGYEGTLHIDALAGRTLELLKQLNYEFSEAERESGRHLAGRIDNIYDDIDVQFNHSNCITKIMHVLREILKGPSAWSWSGSCGGRGTRHEWQGFPQERNNDFEYYTRSQFQLKLGISPEEAEARNGHICKKYNPQRWHVRS